ncbi:hypothetical protein EV424DRAFT_320638 [Suillus variegatus]|nr:hypothetical protein EV424DRAFT_320638 [Suillus variegatus]
MAPNSIEVMWGPGLIGFIIATVLYGISFGQHMFYLRSFPQDSKRLKLFIMTVFLFETIHQFALTAVYWSILISCRRSTSLECTTKIPWQMLLALFMSFLRVQGVDNHWQQSLGHGHNFCGMIVSGLGVYTRSPEALFSTKWSPIASFISALCDSVITVSIWLFMRPARTGNVRRKSRNYINDIMWVFINMGLFSCIVAISVTVLVSDCRLCLQDEGSRRSQYMFQDGLIGQFYTAAPGAVVGNSYVNSMMTVLNARKSIREREQRGYNLTELPTIPTIR